MEIDWLHEGLREAVKTNNLAAVHYCLSKGSDINDSDMFGNTPLHCSVIRWDPYIAKLLLERTDIDPNVVNKDGNTVLHEAAKRGEHKMVKLLLQMIPNIDLNIKNKDGNTPFDLAVEEKQFEIVKLLLLVRTCIDSSRIYKSGDTILQCAVKGGHLNIVQLLLERTDIIDINSLNKDGDTLLHSATKGGYLAIVELLLDRTEIDPKRVNKSGETLIHCAHKGDHFSIVQLLLEKTDIDSNSVNKEGDSLLHSAAKGGYNTIFKLVLAMPGVDPNIVNKEGDSLLHSAAKGGSNAIVKLVLDMPGVDLNVVNKIGDTILHSATKEGHPSIVKLLLERTDIDRNQENKIGNTILQSAVKEGDPSIVKFLLERTDINPNRVNKLGHNLLHSAVREGHPDITQMILERTDIDPYKVNKAKKSSFDIVDETWSDLMIPDKEIRRIQQLMEEKKQDLLVAELKSIGLETADGFKDVMKLGSFKCFWNRVYIVGPYFSGKSCLAKLLVGDALSQERTSTDGIWIYMGRAGMDIDNGEWIFIPKGEAVQEILISMMMTLSTAESLNTKDQTTSIYESEKKERTVILNSNNTEIENSENSALRFLNEKRISQSQKRGKFVAHEYTSKTCHSDENIHMFDVANQSKMHIAILTERRSSNKLSKIVLDGPSKEIVPDTERKPCNIIDAATYKVGILAEESRTSVVEELENRHSKNLPNESSTSKCIPEENITSDDQPERSRSSGVIRSEMYKSGIVEATSIGSTNTSKVDCILDETASEVNKSNEAVAGITTQGVSSSPFPMKPISQVSQTSNADSDITKEMEYSTDIYPKKNCNKTTIPVREKYKEKLTKEVAHELSHNKIHEMVISSIREGKYKQKIIPIDVWDFGGQKDYYMTHQLFITSRGIFVLVFNGSLNLHKHMPDLSFLPGHFGKPTIAVYLLHWVNSILTYCKRSEDGFPRIVFVATHKDKVKKNVDKQKQKLETVIQTIFESHAGLKHLEFKPLMFVNAMNEADPEIQALRERLMDRAKEHPRWGERMPTAWVPLELHLAQQAEKDVNILKKKQIQMFNSQNESMVLTNKQVETFLKVQHSLGKLLYFDLANLRDFVIITPAYLVEVLRSIVTERQFWPKGKQFQNIFHTMQRTGALSRDDIHVIWSQQIFKHILSYEDFIIEVLVHLDILVAERRNTEDLSTSLQDVSQFIVPSMITRPNKTKYMKKNCKTGTSILLSYKFIEEVIPPAFPYRFIASFVDMWGVKNYKNKTRMLFSDLAVVVVDDKHDVAVQVIENRVVVSLIHADKKELIVPTIATSVQECLTAAIHRISEFYSTLSADLFATDKRSKIHMVMPFEIEFGVNCKKTSCFFPHAKLPTSAKWQCSKHKVHHDVKCLKLWFSEKMPREQCDASCKGLGRLEKEQSPSNKQLRRLASSLEVKDCRELLIRLGLDVKVLNDVQEKFAPTAFHENDFKYTAMLRWKGSVTDSSFKTIEDAFCEIDKHLLCEVFRDVNVDDELERFSISEAVANKVPTNITLQELSNHIGNSGIQLGIELGLQSAEIEGIQNDHSCKLLHQNKEILRVWSQTKFPKPTFKDIIKALQRIGKIDCLKEISF